VPHVAEREHYRRPFRCQPEGGSCAQAQQLQQTARRREHLQPHRLGTATGTRNRKKNESGLNGKLIQFKCQINPIKMAN